MASDIKKYTFKPGLRQEFEIVNIGQLYHANKVTLSTPHRAGFYHIIWFQEGEPTHLVDFKPVSIKSNSLLFLDKDTVHGFDKKGGFGGKAILFTDNFFCKTEADTKFLRSSILFNNLFSVTQLPLHKTTQILVQLFEWMEDELQQNKDNYQGNILKNHLHNLMLIAERTLHQTGMTHTHQGADLEYVLLFKELLEDNFRDQKLVSTYAGMLNITEKRLNQATSKILDKSPKQMIDERVLLEAKRLLAHTNNTAKEIGFSLGFDEPTNFIKFFRKHNQVTPAAFRAQYTAS